MLPRLTGLTRQSQSERSGFERLQAEAELLVRIRCLAGEAVNQNLHHYAVLLAVRDLRKRHGGIRILAKDVHPRQTGGATDPDIRGRTTVGDVVCAEVTAHLKPQGYVDTRIRDTLKKLLHMRCRHRYYYVTTSKMERRARTKLSKMPEGRNVTVVPLPAGFDAILDETSNRVRTRRRR